MNEILSLNISITPMTLLLATGASVAAIMFGLLIGKVNNLSETIKRKDFSFAPKHSEKDGSLQWAKPNYDYWTGVYCRS